MQKLEQLRKPKNQNPPEKNIIFPEDLSEFINASLASLMAQEKEFPRSKIFISATSNQKNVSKSFIMTSISLTTKSLNVETIFTQQLGYKPKENFNPEFERLKEIANEKKLIRTLKENFPEEMHDKIIFKDSTAGLKKEELKEIMRKIEQLNIKTDSNLPKINPSRNK